MKLAIVMPVWLQEQAVLDMTIQAVRAVMAPIGTKLIVVPTRLKPELITAEGLAKLLSAQVPWEPGQDLSVAAAWNLGIRIAGSVDRILVLANDTEVAPNFVAKMLAYDGPADLWTGLSQDNLSPTSNEITEGPDFNCFMFRPAMIEKFGWFDEKFRPGYWEDSDYHVRIVHGGGSAVCLHSARFLHRGSATINLDPEAAHHCRHWFEINRARYAAKWGPTSGPPTEAEIRRQCYQTPWNSGRPVSFWDRD